MMDMTIERVGWRHVDYAANMLYFDGHVETMHWKDTAGLAGDIATRGLLHGLDQKDHDVWETGRLD
jgi:prepilin-type processing-associated H-X9-DG protein